MTPQTGRMVKEDGTTANIADLIGGTDTGERVNIDMMAPKSGRFVKEDGSVVNIADVIEEFLAGLAGGGSGSGGTVSLKKLTITVDGQEYIYDGKSAVSIPITTTGGGAAAGQPLQITIGETTYTYTGAEPVTLEIPAAAELQALSITAGGQTHTYDGKSAVAIEIPEPSANKALNISIGGQSYSYDGSAQVDISIPAAEGVQF